MFAKNTFLSFLAVGPLVTAGTALASTEVDFTLPGAPPATMPLRGTGFPLMARVPTVGDMGLYRHGYTATLSSNVSANLPDSVLVAPTPPATSL